MAYIIFMITKQFDKLSLKNDLSSCYKINRWNCLECLVIKSVTVIFLWHLFNMRLINTYKKPDYLYYIIILANQSRKREKETDYHKHSKAMVNWFAQKDDHEKRLTIFSHPNHSTFLSQYCLKFQNKDTKEDIQRKIPKRDFIMSLRSFNAD